MDQIDDVKKYKPKGFNKGENVKAVQICDTSGKTAIKGVCPKTHTEYYKKGTEPAKCSYHSSYNNGNYSSNSKYNNGYSSKTNSKSSTTKSSNNTPTKAATGSTKPTTKAKTKNSARKTTNSNE